MTEFTLAESFGVYKWHIDLTDALGEDCTLFTNVTGGNWKNMKNPRTQALLYTFRREEERPDLVSLIRPLGVILMCEAKKSLVELYNNSSEQTLAKHVEVTNNLATELGDAVPGWSKKEASSTIIPTLLWCTDEDSKPTSDEVSKLFRAFSAELQGGGYDGPMVLVGLEVIKDSEMKLSTRSYVYHGGGNTGLVGALATFLSGVQSVECEVHALTDD